jgi:hypothetical protein
MKMAGGGCSCGMKMAGGGCGCGMKMAGGGCGCGMKMAGGGCGCGINNLFKSVRKYTSFKKNKHKNKTRRTSRRSNKYRGGDFVGNSLTPAYSLNGNIGGISALANPIPIYPVVK